MKQKVKSRGTSKLELTAKEILSKFPIVEAPIRIARRPFFIEFSGTPKSGKTTGALGLDLFLRRNGFRVRTLTERASTCPLSLKDHMFFNVWTACTTLVQMLEALEKEDQIIIVDRGLFDSLCWMHWLEKTARISSEERQIVTNFISLKRWIEITDIVFVLKVLPEVALARESTGQLTHQKGTIMNDDTLRQFNDSLAIIEKENNHFLRKVENIDTSLNDPYTTLEEIAQITMDKLQEFLEEKILVIHKSFLTDMQLNTGFIEDPNTLKKFNEIILQKGKYIERSKAEKNLNYIQPIAIAYLEFKGKFFLLRRSEEDKKNRMHEKYVIWAGGHIREQDSLNGNPLRTGLMRELREELYINNLPKEEFVGIVSDNSNISSSRHIGVIYKFSLDKDDVAISINQKEFKETKGKSVSGSFASPAELEKYFDQMESWSKMLIIQHLKLFNKPLPNQSILLF